MSKELGRVERAILRAIEPGKIDYRGRPVPLCLTSAAHYRLLPREASFPRDQLGYAATNNGPAESDLALYTRSSANIPNTRLPAVTIARAIVLYEPRAADHDPDRPATAVAKVVPVTGAMRSGASIALLVAATLIQCYASRTGSGCAPLSLHATMAECRALAGEYRKFDARALSVTWLPVVVSYRCVAVE